MNVTTMNVTQQAPTKPQPQHGGSHPRLLLLALLAAALAGCGGKSEDPVAQSLIQNADQADVAQAQINLAKATINGGDLPARTLALIRTIRTARDEGVSDSWINKEIDDAESVIIDLCDRCYSMLEDAR